MTGRVSEGASIRTWATTPLVPRAIVFIVQGVALAAALTDLLLQRFCRFCDDLRNQASYGSDWFPNAVTTALTPVTSSMGADIGLAIDIVALLIVNLLFGWAVIRWAPRRMSPVVAAASLVGWTLLSAATLVSAIWVILH